jgi:hypothetical protein
MSSGPERVQAKRSSRLMGRVRRHLVGDRYAGYRHLPMETQEERRARNEVTFRAGN